MAELLYLSDSYQKECDAKITAVLDGGKVALDRTIFFPAGGGVPNDTGKIICGDKEYSIANVRKEGGEVVHYIANADANLSAGLSVHCVLDWERRYHLMRSHTAAHTLAAILYREDMVLITGNQIEMDKIRFDFNLAQFDAEFLKSRIERANAAMKEGHAVKISSMKREDAFKIPEIVKLASALPPAIDVLRIVEIEGVDIQADGGCHVANTSEVGEIEFVKAENKGKENRRVYFRLKN
jgi:misacylated tRNA(Ala) deacylase